MALPISITYTFATATGSIPLSQLDTNFSLLSSTINGIGDGTTALTTPALGTPTSGTLTNCTGYNSANLSGTIPIVNGGTGQTTQTSAFDALSPTTTKGDLIVYNGTDNVKLAVGTDTYVLTADSTTATGVKWAALSASGTVTSVAQTFTGGLISVAGSPITSSGTLALTVAGTSGGIPYFSSGTTWASSSVLAANSLMIGGGAGVAPSTVTTGTGVVTALGVNTGTAGSFVVNGGVLGTPSSGTVTNLTGTASININGTVGATTANTGKFTTLEMTSVTDTSSIARNAGLSANTTVTNTATFTTAGLTLLSQTAAVGSSWRIRAYGQFTAASSATVRTAQIACFWGSTQLVAITPTILASTAQTTQWQVEFELVATSTTAIWTTGTLMSRIASATALAIDNATPASTTVTSGAQTLDLRVRASTAVAAESWIIQQVTIERLE